MLRGTHSAARPSVPVEETPECIALFGWYVDTDHLLELGETLLY